MIEIARYGKQQRFIMVAHTISLGIVFLFIFWNQFQSNWDNFTEWCKFTSKILFLEFTLFEFDKINLFKRFYQT